MQQNGMGAAWQNVGVMQKEKPDRATGRAKGYKSEVQWEKA